MTKEIFPDDRIATQRLEGLLDYVDALVKLDERPATELAQHKLADGTRFALHQHECTGLPAISFDLRDTDGHIWLKVDRLQRIAPPAPDEAVRPWIEIPNDPTKVPNVKDAIHLRVAEAEKARMVEAGQARAEDCVLSLKAAGKDDSQDEYFDVMLRLADRPAIVEAIEIYTTKPWQEWSEREKPRRRSIAIYQRLFEITQRLLQPGGQESVELVWGIGLARWNRKEATIDIPLVERAVEIEIADKKDASISIRPRMVSARVDLRPFEKLAPDKLALAEDAAKRSLKSIEAAEAEGVSPFVPQSFEAILRVCASQLDPDSRYLPDVRPLGPTEAVPPAEDKSLAVSDRFVIFARRRTANSVLRDIERFKEKLGSENVAPTILEGSARTLVMGPSDGVSGDYQPLGNDIGSSSGHIPLADDPIDHDHGDLFFPKPFNRDQVEIIRRLEKSDGLVVQGPPGTGKTHTIANIISHMLATGRRVLVVSHGETALRVIREQLPDGVRDLTISVTTSEREGLKQVEGAIGLMLEIVNRVDTNARQQYNLIQKLQQEIVKFRDRIARIDERLSSIASAHMSPVPGGMEKPFERAQRVTMDREKFGWFTDRPEYPFSEAQLDANAIAALSDARRRVGADLNFLGVDLPAPVNLPAASTVAEWHRDLLAAATLAEGVAGSEPTLRRIVAALGTDAASSLTDQLRAHAGSIEALRHEVWPWTLLDLHLSGSPSLERLRPLALSFINEATELVTQRTIYLARPVLLPSEFSRQADTQAILQSLAAGKNPFGMLSFRSKSHQPVFTQIRISGVSPTGPEDWVHVNNYVVFLERATILATRWRSLRGEFSIPDHIDFDHERIGRLDAITDYLQASLVSSPQWFQFFEEGLEPAFSARTQIREILSDPDKTKQLAEDISSYLSALRLDLVREQISQLNSVFKNDTVDLLAQAKNILASYVGNQKVTTTQIENIWTAVLAKLTRIRSHQSAFARIEETCTLIAAGGAPEWASRLRTEATANENDAVIPSDWQSSWNWASSVAYLEKIGAIHELAQLHQERTAIENDMRETFARVVKERTFFKLAENMRGPAKAALRAFADIIRRLGSGKGQRAALYRQDSRKAMENCYDAVPCWIMPSWRVSEQLPASFGAFDLVILDEASQSDARELPALLRGKKVLVVGDDRQVSPTAAFLSIASIARLRENYLGEFPYRVQVEPGASLYDLARVMFPTQYVLLKEHFRCVEPIIRFSMQFYNEPLVPLRVPRAVERLDPPLVDIFVDDGERRGKSKINPPEAKVIVDEIEKLINDSVLAHFGGDRERPRSIGVISLIGSEQAAYIQRSLMERIGESAMLHHRIACGDSATFQGDERDIMFLSMIADRRHKQSQTALQFEQRFNVAMSRARDRMVLVRSVAEGDLKPTDIKARVLAHFREPMPPINSNASLIDLCQSGFERDVFTALSDCGYLVTPQVGSQGFSIDLVVEGQDGRRLAVECDGDRYHGPDKWADDMQRQRILERVGWTFWRCFGSNWSLDKDGMLEDLTKTLERNGIQPIGASAVTPRYTEHRMVRSTDGDGHGEIGSIVTELEGLDQEANSSAGLSTPRLAAGDRVAIRFIDVKEAKVECYILVEQSGDPLNGTLSLSSPLAKVLADAVVGDELLLTVDGRERSLLVVSLEKEIRKAA